MDNTCAAVEVVIQTIDDTDRKAQLEEILEGLGCYIPETNNQTLRSGGAGTKDPDED